jgi:hypothetical protein
MAGARGPAGQGIRAKILEKNRGGIVGALANRSVLPPLGGGAGPRAGEPRSSMSLDDRQAPDLRRIPLSPPRGAGIPRSFRPAAIWRSETAPCARRCATTGAMSAARCRAAFRGPRAPPGAPSRPAPAVTLRRARTTGLNARSRGSLHAGLRDAPIRCRSLPNRAVEGGSRTLRPLAVIGGLFRECPRAIAYTRQERACRMGPRK